MYFHFFIFVVSEIKQIKVKKDHIVKKDVPVGHESKHYLKGQKRYNVGGGESLRKRGTPNNVSCT